jgi:YVTN family beta-propeller protein
MLAIFYSLLILSVALAKATEYQIFASNEKTGTVSVINGTDFKVTDTISVGKRPARIHARPDGKTIYVALSDTPVEAPPATCQSK